MQQQTRWRRIFLAVSCFMIGFLFLSFFFGEMGFLKFIQMKQTHLQIRNENRTLRQENEKLMQRIEALKADPFAIERIARDRLGLVKERELIYEFYE
ncbi:MAG: septum formation initiator family protein [Candidatus Manganitrophaceae bacterium]